MASELDPEDISTAAQEIFRNTDPNRDLTKAEKNTELPKVRREFLDLLRQIPAFQSASTDELIESLEENRKPVKVNVLLTPGARIDELPERAYYVGLADGVLMVSRKTIVTEKPSVVDIDESVRRLQANPNSNAPSIEDDSILSDELLIETPRGGNKSITYTPGSVETISPGGGSKFKLSTVQSDNTIAIKSARQMQADIKADFK